MFTLLHEQVPVLAPSEDDPTEEELAGHWPRTELSQLPELGEFEERLFRWQRKLSRADYLVLLTTHSGFRMLEEETAEEIVAGLEAVLPDPVVVDVRTQLFLARKL